VILILITFVLSILSAVGKKPLQAFIKAKEVALYAWQKQSTE
jgi:high-affinity Fe2+/Pb2+ permease